MEQPEKINLFEHGFRVVPTKDGTFMVYIGHNTYKWGFSNIHDLMSWLEANWPTKKEAIEIGRLGNGSPVYVEGTKYGLKVVSGPDEQD